jgi:hypothetical protein
MKRILIGLICSLSVVMPPTFCDDRPPPLQKPSSQGAAR